jgi:hypothetical protein
MSELVKTIRDPDERERGDNGEVRIKGFGVADR